MARPSKSVAALGQGLGAAGGQGHGVDEDLGREPADDRPAEVPLVEVVRLVDLPAPLIGQAAGDLPVEPLHVELVVDEAVGQVIEERRVAGGVGQVHVVGRVDDPDAEVVGPDPVDERLGEIRVVLAPEPLHQGGPRVVDPGDGDLVAAEDLGRDDPTRLGLGLLGPLATRAAWPFRLTKTSCQGADLARLAELVESYDSARHPEACRGPVSLLTFWNASRASGAIP